MNDKLNNSKKIRKVLEKSQDEKRYEHTLGVAYTAASLAMRYEADVKKAEIAGLLHDCAKCIDNEKKLSMCQKYNINVNEFERRNPFLLHAKLGSFLAMKKFNITDKDIINAILNHTTGRPEMSLLEKIIYVADYIEPNRMQAPNLREIRRLAFLDLDQAVIKILGDTLQYLDTVNSDIDPMTKKTYDYYNRLLNNQTEQEHS
ncbi:MAG: bis(5'-nucleosyl)-tetraphosphatase (symmetrical) YqeK [Lachnospiraceae bacterium]|nr:bis(5'-nucleosyl)-tetraphosphatase (symmetrical) YqeK [Lachnospiraceae bacterium]